MLMRCSDNIQFPAHSTSIDLNALNIYELVFEYLQELWIDKIDLVPDTAPFSAGEPFTLFAVRSLTFITVNGLRYGVAKKQHGHGYRHVYINGRQAVRIAYIMHVKIIRCNADLPTLEHVCACVELFWPIEDCHEMKTQM